MPESLYESFEHFLIEVLRVTMDGTELEPNWIVAVGEAFGRSTLLRVEKALGGTQVASNPRARIAARAIFGVAGSALIGAVGLAETAASSARIKKYQDASDPARVAQIVTHLQRLEQRYDELAKHYGSSRAFRTAITALFGSAVQV